MTILRRTAERRDAASAAECSIRPGSDASRGASNSKWLDRVSKALLGWVGLIWVAV
jgi:hypothetical protein